MTKELYTMLCGNYGKERDKETYEMYKRMLAGYDEKLIRQAIENIITTDKFMPSTARIIEEIKKLPRIELTEEDKLTRWNKEEITPTWVGKELQPEEMNEIELQELEEEMSIFN